MIYKKDGIEITGDLQIGAIVYPRTWWDDEALRLEHGVTAEPDPLPAPLTQVEIDALIANNIESLKKAANDYESAKISGVAVGMLAVGVLQSKPKALAVKQWSKDIWDLYHARKLLITEVYDEALNDFSVVGQIPYSATELLAEIEP